MKDINTFIQNVETQLENLSVQVYEKVEHLARQAMQEDEKLLSFCMAMGSISFEVETGEWEDEQYYSMQGHLHPFDIESNSQALNSLKSLNNLINDLNVCGMPLKIDNKNAPSLKDW
jgi:predicted hydrolase (HD superfamily)